MKKILPVIMASILVLGVMGCGNKIDADVQTDEKIQGAWISENGDYTLYISAAQMSVKYMADVVNPYRTEFSYAGSGRYSAANEIKGAFTLFGYKDNVEIANVDVTLKIDPADASNNTLEITRIEYAQEEYYYSIAFPKLGKYNNLSGDGTIISKKSGQYAIKIDMIDNESGDSVTAAPSYGKNGDSITLSYTVANTKINNLLDFGGVSAAIASVTTAGSGTRTYTVNADDVSGGSEIIIIATFLHTDLIPDPIAFTDPATIIHKTFGVDTTFTNAITGAHNGSGAITYSSSDETVATVNNGGTVTILKTGSTDITAHKAADAVYAAASRSYTLSVNNQTPIASDYTFGNMSQTEGSVTAVTITPKAGKSPGAVSNIRYAGSTEIPQIARTYVVTFDVAAAAGWNVATLSAGNLVVNEFPPFRSVAYGDDKWVTVGDSGMMAYSADGVTWTAVADSTFGTSIIECVAYGNGRWVAVGESGKMAYSADGIIWTEVANSTFGTSWINSVVYGDDKWVAVGNSGKMAYSADGVTWTTVTNSTFYDYTIFGVAYGNGRWVAVGQSGKMAYSGDGITWIAVADSSFGSSYHAYCVAYGNGRWVAVGAFGRMAYSADDGETWTVVSSPLSGLSTGGVAYGGSRWVAVGGQTNIPGMASSDDGVTWTRVTNTTFTSYILGIAYNSSRWVAVGSHGHIAYSSDNGATWTAAIMP